MAAGARIARLAAARRGAARGGGRRVTTPVTPGAERFADFRHLLRGRPGAAAPESLPEARDPHDSHSLSSRAGDARR
ncbi:hypothetical protein CG719_31280 [Streptomyces sp. CB01373]|nr:hypothetical protein CG719_31280 [Streptomyces sp. CB01373]